MQCGHCMWSSVPHCRLYWIQRLPHKILDNVTVEDTVGASLGRDMHDTIADGLYSFL